MKIYSLAFLLALLAACSHGGTPDGKDAAGAGGCMPMTATPAINPPASPAYTLDPLGPITDVTCDWTDYQPAPAFCVQIDSPEFTPGGIGALTDGSDPACAASGFTPADTNLFKVDIATPELCPGCRRLFLDFERIPPDDPPKYYAHGHAFYRIMSFNPTYTIDPDSHSPNTKDFYNDKFVSPPGTPIATLVNASDHYLMAYVTSTRRFAHTAIQGPYYIGPWYLNRAGQRVHGVYLDLDVADATSLGSPYLDGFRYMAGYNSGQSTCPDNFLDSTADFDFFYFGCFNADGGSADVLDPFAAAPMQ